jgi:hypothetical protein
VKGALDEGRLLVTQDLDFSDIRRLQRGPSGTPLKNNLRAQINQD